MVNEECLDPKTKTPAITFVMRAVIADIHTRILLKDEGRYIERKETIRQRLRMHGRSGQPGPS